MSIGSRIRRVMARVAGLFAILSNINLLVCAIVVAGPLSNQRTVKEFRPSATTAPYPVLQFAMKYLF
jgi:hypothetical protein